MLVILEEPIRSKYGFDTLGLNITVFDSFIILDREDRKFELGVRKALNSDKLDDLSFVRYSIKILDSYQECLDLWEDLINAIKSGDPIFDLRSKKAN